MIRKFIWGVVFMIVVTLGYFGWIEIKFRELIGDWYATFKISSDVYNVEQVEYIRIAFYRDHSAVYEIKKKRTENSIEIGNGLTATSSGFSSSTRTLNGTFQIHKGRVYVTFPTRGFDNLMFDPFVVDDVGTDHETGKSYVMVSLSYGRYGEKLVVRGYNNSAPMAFTQGAPGFKNEYSFKPSENKYLPAQRPVGSEIVSMEEYADGRLVHRRDVTPDQEVRRMSGSRKRVSDSIGDQWSKDSNVQAAAVPAPVKPPEQYIPYVPEQSGSFVDLEMMKSILRTLSTACESFATVNQGRYPLTEFELTSAQPPYLTRPYCGETVDHILYGCQFSTTGYEITAAMEDGSVYAITTGGVLVQRK